MNNNQPLTDSNRKLYSVLAYINLLFIVGLLAGKNDEHVKFHVNNGILLCIIEYVFYIALSIVSAIFSFIPIIGVIVGIVISIASAAGGILFFIIVIKGILAASAGKEEPLFLIGGFLSNVKIVK